MIISILLIGILFYHVDWGNVKSQFASSDLVMISIVLFILTLQFPTKVYKWRKCMEIHRIYYPFLYLQKILCVGFFFNNFLPTNIGGDGYRVIKTLPKDGLKSRSISAVLLERIIGLVISLLLGFFCSIVIVFKYDSYIINLYIITCIVFLSLFILFISLYSKGYLKKAIEKVTSIKKLEVIVYNLKYIISNKKRLFDVTIISILFQLSVITVIFILFKAFQIETLFVNCAVIAALAGAFSLLPISINGIGVFEGGFVYIAMQMGISFEQSVIVALMLRVLNFPFSLICGVVYLADSRKG